MILQNINIPARLMELVNAKGGYFETHDSHGFYMDVYFPNKQSCCIDATPGIRGWPRSEWENGELVKSYPAGIVLVRRKGADPIQFDLNTDKGWGLLDACLERLAGPVAKLSEVFEDASTAAAERVTEQAAETIGGLRKELDGMSRFLRELIEEPIHKKIPRIKVVRAHTGLGLRVAKEVIDVLNESIPTTSTEVDRFAQNRESDTLRRELRLRSESLDGERRKAEDLDAGVSHLQWQLAQEEGKVKGLLEEISGYKARVADMKLALKVIEALAHEIQECDLACAIGDTIKLLNIRGED